MSEVPAGLGREILYRKTDGHIAIVTLNRPDKRNAVNAALAQALDHVVRQSECDPDVRVVVLGSSNDKSFCAGADLAEVAQGGANRLFTPEGGFAGFVDSKRRKPWIAAIKGAALAGGCELALACDLVVAAHDTKFGIPEVKRGLFAAAGGAHRLVRALPRNLAIELVITGDSLDAPRAHLLGLVNRLAPADAVDETALSLARSIAENAPCAVLESLHVARLGSELTDAQLRALSDEALQRIMATEDAKEGPRAFLEKRAPKWQGR